ncbi:MAG TPA: ADOP family duplicated permease [Thermoanaerobaculia bacterium]|nr:ADOP family duplicated permease [Thermoanaerobaculia bacterium]
MLPHRERDEVLGDLAVEHRARVRSSGRLAAWYWVWSQVLASLPVLARRGWWRGWTGFETPAERLQPGEVMFESWAIDVRYALRRLRQRPTYAALTVLTLALGVAGTAAVSGIARQLLLEPLPIRAEEEVAVFWFEGAWSEAELAYLRPQIEVFPSLAAFRHADVTLRVGDEPARLIKGYAGTAELFEVLGREPAIGPGFQPGDDQLGAQPVAVLSHALWRELGGDPALLGRQLELSGQSRTVVGVMPPGFWFPDPTVRIWVSEDVDPENQSGNYGLIARLPPGAGIEAMGSELERIARLLSERFDYPEQWDPTMNPELIPVRQRILGTVEPALLALLGATAVILLIAAVNVSALMLGQVESRGTELAVRRALGAGRKRLLQQLAVESLVIALLAGLAGSALAAAGFRFLVSVLPLGALAETASLDWMLFWSALGIAVVSGAVVAMAPGLSAVRGGLQARLQRGRTRGVAGRGGRLEQALVVAQVALVLLLMSGAALLVRSVANLRAIDPALDVGRVAVIDVQIPATLGAARMPQLLGELVAAVEALPEVESAASTQRLPLRGSSDNWGIQVEGRPELETTTTAFRVVTPGYLSALGLRVERGRGLLETDRDAEAEVGAVVINEALAQNYFPDVDPLGRRIRFMDRWDRVVGVVEDVAEAELTTGPVPARYMVYEQVPFLLPWQTIVVRAAEGLDPATVLDPARRAIQQAAPSVAIRELTTLESVVTRAIGPALQLMWLLAVLASLALVLGAIGIYGVVSHFVTRRTKDWGIRVTLGLAPGRLAGQIVGRGGALVAAGVVVGGIASLGLARLLSAFLHEVGANDPLALAGAAAVLFAAGLLAAAVPARRAGRVALAKVLREQ